MNYKENQEGGRVSLEDNTKIIELIKSKINPLHSKVHYHVKEALLTLYSPQQIPVQLSTPHEKINTST